MGMDYRTDANDSELQTKIYAKMPHLSQYFISNSSQKNVSTRKGLRYL